MNTSTTEPKFPFTVLLLKPDTVAQNFGQDVALLHVEACSVAAAQVAAREKACEADHPTEEDREASSTEAWDYHVLAVFEGHLTDQKVD